MRYQWLVWPLFAAIMGFALGGSFVWGLQETKPNYQTDPTKAERQHIESNASRTKTVANEQPHEGGQKGKWYDTFLNHTPNWFVAIFTALLTFVTYRLVSSTNKLWEAGERQIELAKDTAAAQSRDMQDSLKVARAANKVAEAALIANDRAWISINAEVIAPLVFEKDRVHIGVGFNLTNVGNSPATHVEILAELCPDIIAAEGRGKMAAGINSLSMFSFGVVMFPGDVVERDWLEMEMPLDQFRARIAEAKTRARERGEDEAEVATAWPGIMVRAAYKLAGSTNARHTVILYEVRTKFTGQASANPLGWDGSEGKTDLVYLNLVQTFMSGQVI